MPTPFISLTATHNPHRWYLPLDDSLCVGPPQRSLLATASQSCIVRLHDESRREGG
ncbi:hypothetical protein [Phenylobacterium sp.]|uniref:hypothetical protein n=1 Tax=Phenylobacterium sp. TaxID=1871053 RepID=UPI002F404CBA